MKQTLQRDIGLLIIGDEVLSGKRQDRHLIQANQLLRLRGLAPNWVQILGDEPSRLQSALERSFASGDVVFCFGGIGATPDDRTRQCAAAALNLPIERHPEGVAEIEAQYGAKAYPHRVLMAEYPQGATIIPNEYNRVPGFSIQDHHFMPGFPMMAKPMMAWVLDNHYSDWCRVPLVEQGVRIFEAHESEWIEFMRQFEIQFPELRLFSLPSIREDGQRWIELGVEGLAEQVAQGVEVIVAEVTRRTAQWEFLA